MASFFGNDPWSIFEDVQGIAAEMNSRYINDLSKAGILLIVVVAVGVALLSFCSRSVSIAFMVGRAAVGCFEKATIRRAAQTYAWMTFGFTEMLFLLMPILIFETSFTTKIHDFRRFRWQILIVGGLCYLVDVGLYGLMIYVQMSVVHIIFPKQAVIWSKLDSWMYASIAGATNTIADATMLYQVWTPHPLCVIVKGESLISNGMAVLTYHTFNVSSQAPSDNAAGYIATGMGLRLLGVVLFCGSARVASTFDRRKREYQNRMREEIEGAVRSNRRSRSLRWDQDLVEPLAIFCTTPCNSSKPRNNWAN